MGLMVFVVVFVGITGFIQFVPNFGLTLGKRIVVALGTNVGYVGTCLLVAATKVIGFPIPFIWQGGGLMVGIYIPMMFLLLFGMAPFAKNSPFRPHLHRYLRLLVAYMSLGAVFPLYKLLYESIPEKYRGGALIVLPLWKFAAKHFVMWASRELKDFVPVVVALTVDFFSAMFVSVCISSSGSIYLWILFIAADVGQAMLEFREVRANSKTILELLESRQEYLEFIQQDSGHAPSNPSTANLLTRLVAVTRNPSAFAVVSLKHTRLWACLPHPLTFEQADQLKVLEKSGVYGSRGLLSKRRKRQHRHQSLRTEPVKNNSIVPASIDRRISKSSTRELEGESKQGEKSRELVEQGLQLLFHCEYLALVEYVECVIPLVFATNKLVLKQLPNAIYYPGGAGKWSVTALTNVFVFAALEIGSLLLLHYFLHRKFAFSPLHQLTFALETSVHFVQVALFLEVVGLLQYELAHLGADFTFRFEWLDEK